MLDFETTDRPALTERQQKIYDFVREKIVSRGYGPTVRDIGSHFGIRSPNGVMCHLKALEKKGLITREPGKSRAIQLTDPPLGRTTLPLAGQIAAGVPVLAEEQTEAVDFADLFSSDEQFCLKVKGDSMIEAHIQDGDFVVIRKQSTARNGDIVAAIVDGNDATLKYYYKDGSKFRLEPANSSMKPIFTKDLEIRGVLVGVIRQY
ncbi:transcriptional repressor LexA [Stratiformator vulcanicus]|uniref:LexA repressor n=1 Tax=Stratiformator vulcanicus TaxID=2527980 RepID=A0A517R5M5_9PLAN|nr:transcriptional repressor LexA [Stratiformator vulcanicus]QDT39197.1 LexA repressor [Stratiformator vulcanicus]